LSERAAFMAASVITVMSGERIIWPRAGLESGGHVARRVP
jgi:hypothetical protein